MSNDEAVPTVFAWITGERTNIGDSLLRRPYVRALSRVGRLSVWTRASTPAFLTGVALPPDSEAERSFIKWYAAMLWSAVRRPTVLALNAGQTPSSRSAIPAAVLLGFAARIVHWRGGRALWLGASLAPELSARQFEAYRRLAQRIDTLAWRESRSQSQVQLGTVQPDWAFAEGSATTSWAQYDRHHLSVVLRGDRSFPDAAWLDWVRMSAANLGLRILLIVQVQQDADRARQVAEELGGEVVEWKPEGTHEEQEFVVRSAYRQSRVVIGDRLHGLVMAATEGAVPLGWVPSSRGKIRLHFDPVDLDWVSLHEGDELTSVPTLTLDYVAGLDSDMQVKIERARTALSSAAEQLLR